MLLITSLSLPLEGGVGGGLPLRRVVGFGDARLDHHGGVAALIELGFVRNRAHYVTRTQSEGRTERGERGNEYRNDDFDDLLLAHSGLGFSVYWGPRRNL